jgi:hypothetical protein
VTDPGRRWIGDGGGGGEDRGWQLWRTTDHGRGWTAAAAAAAADREKDKRVANSRLGSGRKKQERGAAEQRTKHRSSDIPMLKKCSNDHDFFSESVTNFISFQTSIKSLKTEFEVKKYS